MNALTKLIHAIKTRNVAMIAPLLAQIGTADDIIAQRFGPEGYTLLHLAVLYATQDGDLSVLTELFETFSRAHEWLNAPMANGLKPADLLDKPCRDYHREHTLHRQQQVLKLLLDHTPRTQDETAWFQQELPCSPYFGYSLIRGKSNVVFPTLPPLTTACAMGNHALMAELIQRGAAPGKKSRAYSSAQLQHAVQQTGSREQQTPALTQALTQETPAQEIATAFLIAADNSDSTAIDLLIQHNKGASIDPFALAIAFDRWKHAPFDKKETATAILKKLLRLMTEFANFPAELDSPMMIACTLGDLTLVQELQQKYDRVGSSAAVFAPNPFAENPFHVICKNGYLELLDYFLTTGDNDDYRADRNAALAQVNVHGQTPLFLACAATTYDKAKRNAIVERVLPLARHTIRSEMNVLSLPCLYESNEQNKALLAALLAADAEPNAYGRNLPPLVALFQQPHPDTDMVKALLDKGASLAVDEIVDHPCQVDFYLRACELSDIALLTLLFEHDHGQSIQSITLGQAHTNTFIETGELPHTEIFYTPYQLSLSSLITDNRATINALHYLARKGNFYFLKRFCDQVPASVLARLLAQGALSYSALASHNPEFNPSGVSLISHNIGLFRRDSVVCSNQRFDKMIQDPLCIQHIHDYLVIKSQESASDNKQRYRERLTHFARLVNTLNEIKDNLTFAEQCYRILANIPELEAQGYSIFGVNLTKTQDRYRGLLTILREVPADIIRRRLKEYLLLIAREDNNAHAGAESAFIADLKSQRERRVVPLTQCPPVVTPNDRVALDAIQTGNIAQAEYCLKVSKIAVFTGHTFLNEVVTSAFNNNTLTFLQQMLAALHRVDAVGLGQLLIMKVGNGDTVFSIAHGSEHPLRQQVIDLLLQYATLTGILDDSVLLLAAEVERVDFIKRALDNKTAKISVMLLEKIYGIAMRNGYLSLITLLIESKYSNQIPILEHCQNYWSSSLNENQRQALLLVLTRMINARNVGSSDIAQYDTPLIRVCYLNNPELIARYLTLVPNVKSVNKSSLSALHIAIARGVKLDLCLAILSKYTQPEMIKLIRRIIAGTTILHLVCQYQEQAPGERLVLFTKIIESILPATISSVGAHKIDEENIYGFTPLHVAFLQKDGPLIKRLIHEGAFINATVANFKQTDTSADESDLKCLGPPPAAPMTGFTALGIACVLANQDPTCFDLVRELYAASTFTNPVCANTPALNWACGANEWDFARQLLTIPEVIQRMSTKNKWDIINSQTVPVDIKESVLRQGLMAQTEFKGLTLTGARFLLPLLLTASANTFEELRKEVQAFYVGAENISSVTLLLTEVCQVNDLSLLREFLVMFQLDPAPRLDIPAHVNLLQTVARHGTLGQFHAVCRTMPASVIALARDEANTKLQLRTLVAGNPKIPFRDTEPDYELNIELNSALCFHNIHLYLEKKSQQKNEDEVRRYQQRLHDFVNLLVDIERMLELEPAAFNDALAARLAEMPDLEIKPTLFLGRIALKESQDRYRKLREALTDVEPQVLKMRCREYLDTVHRLKPTSDVSLSAPAESREVSFAGVVRESMRQRKEELAAQPAAVADNDAEISATGDVRTGVEFTGGWV